MCCKGSDEAWRNMHRDVMKWILMLMSHMLKLLHWIIAQVLQCTLKSSAQIHEIELSSDAKIISGEKKTFLYEIGGLVKTRL